MPRPRRTLPTSAQHDAIERAAAEILAKILERLDSSADGERILPFCRVADLVPPRGPFSKATVFRLLADGRLRAIKVGDVLLVELESVRELLASAERYSPGCGRGAAARTAKQ